MFLKCWATDAQLLFNVLASRAQISHASRNRSVLPTYSQVSLLSKQGTTYIRKEFSEKKLLENKEIGFKNAKVVKQADSLNKDLRVEKLIYSFYKETMLVLRFDLCYLK